MKKTMIIIVMVTITMSSCGIFPPQRPEVMRYHKKITGIDKVTDQKVSDTLFKVNAFVLDPLVGSSKTLFDLSAEGQAAMIESIAKLTKDPEELNAALANPIKESSGNSNLRGSTTWKKRIVLNITKTDKERANRLQYILFKITLPESLKDKVELISWDKIVTETQAIDLGKITSSTATSFSLSPEITMAGTMVGATAGSVSTTRNFGEEKNLSGKNVGLNAAIVSPSQLEVLRQALPYEDISGNIVIELTLRSKLVKPSTIYTITGLFDGTKPVTDPLKIGVKKTMIIQPNFGAIKDVSTDLNYVYRYRTVNGISAATEPESDDYVTYKDGNITENEKFKLFTDTDTEKNKSWEIKSGNNYLHIVLDGELQQLVFDNYNTPAQFLSWLKLTKKLSVANGDLYLGLEKLTASDIQDLKVQPSN